MSINRGMYIAEAQQSDSFDLIHFHGVIRDSPWGAFPNAILHTLH